MALSPGSRLGSYEITAPLGAGGMGEVYRARDTNLGREVALKILPEAFANDPDRLMRFEREARTLASLNHPHIAQVYGIEDSGTTRALVMELVEGRDLSARIARGPIPIDEALPIARQISEALEAAHEAGIIHRDLKPANIKVRDDGAVKVLDFGLAKALDVPPDALTHAATITSPAMTMRGVILGTAAYMSPEQARGRVVDKRADIWAFGCVLYEMLTGRRAFDGEEVSDTVAEVIKGAPDWAALPPETPAPIRRLLQRCLAKELKARVPDISVARFELDTVMRDGELEEPVAAERPSRRRLREWLAWGVATALLIALAALMLRPDIDHPTATRFSLAIVPPPGTALVTEGSYLSTPEISPDGNAVLFATERGYFVRRLDEAEARPVQGTERGTSGTAFWSPDSMSVAFSRPDIVRVRLPDGAPQAIATSWRFPTRGGSWGRRDSILLGARTEAAEGERGALLLVPAAGGEPKVLTLSDVPGKEYLYPEFIAGTDDFLFLVDREDGSPREVYMATLRDGEIVGAVALLKNETAARYTPAGDGRLLFVQNDNLYAQRLNLAKRALEGDAELIVKGVVSQPGNTFPHADFSVSHTGIIVWRAGQAALSQVTSFDRTGAQLGTVGPPASVGSIYLAPDDTRVLITTTTDARVVDVEQSGERKLPQQIDWRAWSPDGSKVLGLTRQMVMMEAHVDQPGDPKPIGEILGPMFVGSFTVTPDTSAVLVMSAGGSVASWAHVGGNASQRTLKPLTTAGLQSFHYRFSPDGRWIVYVTAVPKSVMATGDVFVQPFPGPGRPRRIATQGSQPEWRRDGKEIVFLDATGVAAVAVEAAGNDLRFGAPQHLFATAVRAPGGPPWAVRLLGVSSDGSRFYYPQRIEQPQAGVIQVKTQWTSR